MNFFNTLMKLGTNAQRNILVRKVNLQRFFLIIAKITKNCLCFFRKIRVYKEQVYNKRFYINCREFMRC